LRDLTTGKEYRAIMAFTLPILIGNIFQQMYNVIDSIVVGRILGTESLAAVGLCFQINLLLVAITVGVTLGVGIIISQCFGAKDYDKIYDVIQTGYAFTSIIAIVITVTGFVFCENILILVRVPNDILPLTLTYLRIIFLGIIPSFMYNAVSNVLRGLGDSKAPVYFLISAALLNLVLAIAFVAVFRWGISGAAYATVISQLFSFIGIYYYLNKKYPQFQVRIRDWRIKRQILKQCLEISIPAAMQQVFISLGLIVIQILINSFGSECMAAYAAASRIDGFALMPAQNMGQALSIFTAQNIGAKKNDRVVNGYKATMLIGSVLSIVLGLIIIMFPDILMKLFSNDIGILEIGRSYLRIIASAYIIFAAMHITNGALLGYGKTFVPMISSIVSLCLLQVPIAISLSGYLGYVGIWIATPIGWTGGLIIRAVYFYKKVKVSK